MNLLRSSDTSRSTSLDPTQLPFLDVAYRRAVPPVADAAFRAPRSPFTHGVFGDPLPLSTDAAIAPTPAEAFDPRARTAGILILQCGMMLLIGLVSQSWFSGPGGELGVLGIEECRGTVCQTLSWLDATHVATELQALSVVALLGGLVAVGFLLQAGVVLLTSRPTPRMLRGLGIALGVAAVGLASFFAVLVAGGAGDHARGAQVSWAGVLALSTVIGAGLLALVLVRPLARAAKSSPPAP